VAAVARDFGVRDHGVLVSVVAVPTGEGGLRVRFGHRRTAAALEVGADTIPVLVVADGATTDDAEVGRLVGELLHEGSEPQAADASEEDKADTRTEEAT